MSRRKLILFGFLLIALSAAAVATFMPSGTDANDPTMVITLVGPGQVASPSLEVVDSSGSAMITLEGDTPIVVVTPAETTLPFYTPTWAGAVPILTQDHQGLTFGPGQLVFVYAEGLGKDQKVSITLSHAEQGQLAQAETTSDFTGHASVKHLVRKSAEAEGARPAGDLTFTLSTGDVSESLTFTIDYQKVFEKPKPAVGISATRVQSGTAVAFWCSGFEEGATITPALTVNGQAATNPADLFELNPAGSDGVVIGLLTVFEQDPKGIWTIQSGLESCRVSFKVE